MAAGQGFKTFATGDVLTAPDVNGYLMQGVLVFANASARTAAITSPQQGQVSFLKDTNSTEYYTGSAWVAIGGGGMTNPMTTSGDTIYGGASGTPTRLGIGSTGQVLTVAGGVPTWAASGGGGGSGAVVQVKSITKADTFVTNSTSFVDISGLLVSITPTSSSNKILVMYDCWFVGDSNYNWPLIRLMRGSTPIKVGAASGGLAEVTGGAYTVQNYTPYANTAGTYLDSPATTSATNYNIQIQKTGGTSGDNVYVNRTQADSEYNRGRYASTMTVMEVTP
jgi:hypothetical protein